MKRFGTGGKLNIIDVIVILILAAAVVFVGMKLVGGDEPAPSQTQTQMPEEEENVLTEPNVRFLVICDELTPELARSAQDSILNPEPLLLTDSEEPEEAEEAESTESTEATEAAEVETVAANRIFNSNKFVDAQITECRMEEKDGLCTLYITIEGNALIKGGIYNVGTQEIRIGKEIWVKTLDVELVGTVSTLEKLS